MRNCTLSFACTLLLLAACYSVHAQALHDAHSGAPKTAAADTGIVPDSQNIAADSSSDASPPKKSGIIDTIHYESEHIDYDAEKKILHLVGKSSVKYQDLTLQADTIIYLMNQDLFTASGHPQLIERNDTTVGEFMSYNIKTRKGRVRYATTHLDEAYFNGQHILKTEDNQLYVDKGDYTTCAMVDTPHYFFYGRDIKLSPNDKIISRPVVLNIGGAPVAALPYFIFPTERGRRSGFLSPVWRGQPTGGGYLDNIGYYYAPNDYIDFIGQGSIREFREYVLSASSRYALKYWLNGGISGRYVLTSDFLEQRNEWALDYFHSQNITPDGLTRLSGRGSLVSEKRFYERFSEDTSELKEQTLSANMSLSHRFEKINGSANVVWNRTHNLQTDLIVEDMPSIDFSLPSRPIIAQKKQNEFTSSQPDDTAGPKWFHKIYWDYSGKGIVKSNRYGDNTVQGFTKPGALNSASLSSPQTIFKYFTINPSISGKIATFYGYIDTTILDTLKLYDTVTYVQPDTAVDKRYPDYTLIRTTRTTRDSLGETITEDSITKVSPVRREYVRDTSDGFWNVPTWRTGVSLSTHLYGLFPFRILNFGGLRHTLTPSVSYTFVPEHNLDKMFYNIGIIPDPANKQQQIIGLSLGNQFQGKLIRKSAAREGEKPTEEKFDILSANLNTSYDFEAEGRKWSDLGLSAHTAYKFINVGYSSGFWLYDQFDNQSWPLLRNVNVTVSMGSLGAKGKFWGGDLLVLDSLQPDILGKYYNTGNQAWNINFSPSYTYSLQRASPTDVFVPNKSYSLSASASANITRNWSMRWNGNYNFVENQFVQNSINLACDMECWDMRFEWRPERLNPGYYFLVNIKKIPEIKWEQRP